MKTVIKGRVFVYLLSVLIVIWQSYIYVCTLSESAQETIEVTSIVIFSACYLILRVGLQIENYKRYGEERAILGKSFMACGTPTLRGCDDNYVYYWMAMILSFMPLYFLAYVLLKISTHPIKFWFAILEWADNYLTIKKKSNEN